MCKHILWGLILLFVLSACGSSPDSETKEALGYLCSMGEQYEIYSFSFEEPVLLELDKLSDEHHNMVNPGDLSLGMPVTLLVESDKTICGIVDLAEYEANQPAGLPNGFILSSCLYYDGAIYEDTLEAPLTKLPENFQLEFTIEKNSGVDFPTQNGEACHVDLGCRIYISESSSDELYVETPEGFLHFTKTNQ